MKDKKYVWCACTKCGRDIFIGEICYDIGFYTVCSDCCTPRNTLHEWKLKAEAEDDGSY